MTLDEIFMILSNYKMIYLDSFHVDWWPFVPFDRLRFAVFVVARIKLIPVVYQLMLVARGQLLPMECHLHCAPKEKNSFNTADSTRTSMTRHVNSLDFVLAVHWMTSVVHCLVEWCQCVGLTHTVHCHCLQSKLCPTVVDPHYSTIVNLSAGDVALELMRQCSVQYCLQCPELYKLVLQSRWVTVVAECRVSFSVAVVHE